MSKLLPRRAGKLPENEESQSGSPAILFETHGSRADFNTGAGLRNA